MKLCELLRNESFRNEVLYRRFQKVIALRSSGYYTYHHNSQAVCVPWYCHKQERRCTYNMILTRIRVTISTVKKYYIFCVCIFSLSYSARNAHAPYYIVICCLLGCTICLHNISQTARFLRKNVIERKMFVFMFSTNFVRNISHSTNNSA